MISGVLHLIFVLFAFLIGGGIYNAYRRGGYVNKQLRDFSVFFLLLSVYRFFLFFPLLFFSDNLNVAYWSYNAAIFVFFVMISVALKVPLDILRLKTKTIRIILASLVSIGIMVVSAQIFYPRLPIIDLSGFVFWNANPFAAWITSLAGFLVGMTWAYTFIKNFPKDVNLPEKIKTVLIIITAFTLGIGSLIYFPFHHSSVTLAAFAIVLVSSLCILAVILISLLNRKKTASGEL